MPGGFRCVQEIRAYTGGVTEGHVWTEEQVASFKLKKAEYGNVYFPGGTVRRKFAVTVECCLGANKSKSIIVTKWDNLYNNAEQYTQSNPDIVVSDPRRFKMYASEKRQDPSYHKHNPLLDAALFIGLFKEQHQLSAVVKADFPRGEQDCWYHNSKLSSGGDANTSFQEIANLTRYTDVLLVHSLGAPLKAILGFYPHGLIIAKCGVGKSTTINCIAARTGIGVSSSKKQMGSNYRQNRALGNHNLPIFLDEISRIEQYSESGLLEVLNTAYNRAPSTHATDGYYMLSGCAVMFGQDRGCSDDAIESKQIILHFDRKDINEDALINAQSTVTPFPMVEWLEFLAKNGLNALSILREKEEWLRSQLKLSGINYKGSERIVSNYAAVLVSGKYLNDFNVHLNIELKCLEICKLHLEGKLHDGDDQPIGTSSGEKFVRDILNAVTLNHHKQRMSGSFDITADGVWFKLEPWFDYLKQANPNRYDEKGAARMGGAVAELSNRGMRKDKHRFGNSRLPAWFIPNKLCVDLGVEFESGTEEEQIK